MSRPYERYELGPFTVSFTPSAHSKLLLGLAVPFDGELTCDHLDALSPGAYRCGEIYGIEITVAGMSFYHQGSANLIDDAVRSTDVDVFLAGVAGRGFTRDYWRRILTRLQPRTIVPTHYDDFFRPLDAEMGFTTNVNLAHVPDEVHAVSRDFAVAALPLRRSRGRDAPRASRASDCSRACPRRAHRRAAPPAASAATAQQTIARLNAQRSANGIPGRHHRGRRAVRRVSPARQLHVAQQHPHPRRGPEQPRLHHRGRERRAERGPHPGIATGTAATRTSSRRCTSISCSRRAC